MDIQWRESWKADLKNPSEWQILVAKIKSNLLNIHINLIVKIKKYITFNSNKLNYSTICTQITFLFFAGFCRKELNSWKNKIQ